MENSSTKAFVIRDAVDGDKAFVLATFLRGLYYGNSFFGQIPKDIFMTNYHIFAQKLYDNSTVKVACLPDATDVIVGYSILSKDFQAVHYVYVKAAWRGNGIGRTLTPTHPVSVSHLTTLGAKLLPKLPGAVFNPFRF